MPAQVHTLAGSGWDSVTSIDPPSPSAHTGQGTQELEDGRWAEGRLQAPGAAPRPGITEVMFERKSWAVREC